MNLFELQERLKDFSQDQLVREMQAPTGAAPQYLVLSELQRRQRMMAEQQAQMPEDQTTVAQDAVAAAGVPQGGLADMAQALAPRTDMDMNTGVAPVERMQAGGMVGGAMGDPLAPYAQYLDQTYSNPTIESFVENVKNMEQQTFGNPGMAPAMRGPMQTTMPQVGGMRQFGVMPSVDTAANMQQFQLAQRSAELARQNAAATPAQPMRALQPLPGVLPGLNPVANRLSFGMAEGGVVRMQPGGLAGISRNIRDFAPRLPEEIAGIPREDFLRLSPEEQLDIIQFEDPTAAMRERGAEVYPEYDYRPTGQGFFIETFAPGAAEEIRQRNAAIQAAEEAAAAETEEAAAPSVEEVFDLSPGITLDSEPGLSFGEEFGDVDPALVRRGGTEELTFGDITPTDAEIPFALPEGMQEEEVPPPPRTDGGATAPAASSALSQDKWLALAQAGLSLMSSNQPTIGGAIGEAGLAGLTALREAQARQESRTEREQARADRLAAAAARGERDTYPYRQVDDIIGMADSYAQAAASIVENNFGTPPVEGDPNYEQYINSLAMANVLRRRALALSGLE